MANKKVFEKHVMFENRPYFRGKRCNFCGLKLNQPFKIMEEQVSIFRGDDEVYAFHLECPYEVKIHYND